MKGNSEKTVELSLLGVAKALAADVNVVLPTNGASVSSGTYKYRVDLTENVNLDTRESSRAREINEFVAPEKLNAQGRVITGEMPVLFPVGFKTIKDSKGEDEIVFTEGTHCMIAGNFTTVFSGTTCAECAASYNKAIADGKKVWVQATFSASGKWWLEFSVE